MAQADKDEEVGAPVAREDVMRPTQPAGQKQESAPGLAGTPSTTSTTTNAQLTMQEVIEIETMAREAADHGSEALSKFFKTLNTLNKQAVFKGLREELVKRRQDADFRLDFGGATAKTEATEWIDEETGEVHSA
jgi:uncharacterized protein with von Willebrand factor type A (vWA) domain